VTGPGSGKTRAVIARVIWLLKQGVPSQQILAITFTRKVDFVLAHCTAAMYAEVSTVESKEVHHHLSHLCPFYCCTAKTGALLV